MTTSIVVTLLSLLIMSVVTVVVSRPFYRHHKQHKKSVAKIIETRRERMKESMIMSKLLNKREHELKESALLWGIADNNTDINTLDLLDETNYLKESLGEEFFDGFIDNIVDKAKEIHWRVSSAPSITKELSSVSVSRYVKKVVDASKLVTIKIIEIITFTLGGDRNDGEEGSIVC